MYNKQIDKLLWKNIKPSNPQEVLHSICYQWENKNGDDEIEILAFFSTKEKARKALKELLKIPELKLITDRLDVYEENINWKEWSEGFITTKEALRKIREDKNEENYKYKKPKSHLSDKENAEDVPAWAAGKRPYKGESGEEFAKRLMNEKYG